ncbi:MAG: type I-U CRISPR-associated protein Cas5/Cas6 [Proteobacteria bacterium]|nr:type I-U CRISPR-associated protein Cas5/Cas6 [Pseudomonadota bacterium]
MAKRSKKTHRIVSVSLAFWFLAGRYHATPFGHHVNEGLIEWPPSPWRLLRALISVGYTSGVWNSAGLPAAARSLCENLSGELPRYHLPPTVGAHSRHYMPTGVLDGRTKIEKTTLAFDTWAQVEDQEMTITWNNVGLSETERAILEALVGRLNYLGRSESWVEGRVMGAGEPIPETNCFPEQSGERPAHGSEQVSILAPVSASDFQLWRATQLDKALADLPLPEGRKPTKSLLAKRVRAVQPYPANLLDCLQKDTTWLRAQGWSWPPGSRRVSYWQPSDAVSFGSPSTRTAFKAEQRVAAMLLSLADASRNDHALPPVTRTLPQAELLHRALVRIAARNGVPPPELTGRDGKGQPLRGPHEHAHINPLDLDGDGHLDHILVWAPGGLGAAAQTAIRAARTMYTKDSNPLRLALSGAGDLLDFVQLSSKYGQRIARIRHPAPSWQSTTPFVPPRHIKVRGKNTLEGQIRAELCSRGLPEPVAVHQLAPMHGYRSDAATIGAAGEGGKSTWARFRHFKLVRQHGPEPPFAGGFAVRLDFEHPVSGPIAIGYGSHFGLGLFERCASVQAGAASDG